MRASCRSCSFSFPFVPSHSWSRFWGRCFSWGGSRCISRGGNRWHKRWSWWVNIGIIPLCTGNVMMMPMPSKKQTSNQQSCWNIHPKSTQLLLLRSVWDKKNVWDTWNDFVLKSSTEANSGNGCNRSWCPKRLCDVFSAFDSNGIGNMWALWCDIVMCFQLSIQMYTYVSSLMWDYHDVECIIELEWRAIIFRRGIIIASIADYECLRQRNKYCDRSFSDLVIRCMQFLHRIFHAFGCTQFLHGIFHATSSVCHLKLSRVLRNITDTPLSLTHPCCSQSIRGDEYPPQEEELLWRRT